MSLDFYLKGEEKCWTCGHKDDDVSLFVHNITHNLTTMAREVDVKFYEALWRSQDHYEAAEDMIPVLKRGIKELVENPDKYQEFNPDNGWGDYNGLLRASKEILEACREFPESKPYSCV